jgi:hypothetical protein
MVCHIGAGISIKIIVLAISNYNWIQRPDNKVHIKCRMLKTHSGQTLKSPFVFLGFCPNMLAAILPGFQTATAK